MKKELNGRKEATGSLSSKRNTKISISLTTKQLNYLLFFKLNDPETLLVVEVTHISGKTHTKKVFILKAAS